MYCLRCLSQNWLHAVIMVILIFMSFPATAQTYFGSFPEDPLVSLDRKGELITLKKPFSFFDEKKREWRVSAGYKSNGASIPRAFWTPIGSPLTGKYRNAAIIHDYFCDRKAHDWSEVHQIFYKGMRANGVDSRLAWVMYKAVYYFGPRWEKRIETPEECKPGPKFSPEKCVFNQDPVIIDTTQRLNRANFEAFLNDLKRDGFDREAENLRVQLSSQIQP